MLTDPQVKAAKGKAAPYKMGDSGSLFLFVTPKGSKLWRMKYRIGGKEAILSFGPYPLVSLSSARQARDDAKRDLLEGRDPSLNRRTLRKNATSPDHSFEVIARAWHENEKGRWTERHANDVITSLESGVFPKLGKEDIREISVPATLEVIREIERRPAVETAHRVRQRMSAVFQFAISSGLASSDPAAQIQGALKPIKHGRQPALVSLDEARKILRDVESTPAHPVTRFAMRFIALTAMRPGEVRSASMTEMNLGDDPTWNIPAEKMKMRRAHSVPLSRQAVEILSAIQPLTGTMQYIFPNARHGNKPMSENALSYLLNRAGYHGRHVPHGWRAAFSSIMNEMYPQDRAVIDLMLAHVPKDAVERAYNRAEHSERRRELAQIWADLIMDGLPPPEDITKGARR